MIYLDTSALFKLVVREDRTSELVSHLASYPRLVSSALARTELPIAASRISPEAAGRARFLFRHTVLTRPVSDDLLEEAGALRPPTGVMLRSLDAIHLVTARRLGTNVPLITYDKRMAEVALSFGHPVISP